MSSRNLLLHKHNEDSGKTVKINQYQWTSQKLALHFFFLIRAAESVGTVVQVSCMPLTASSHSLHQDCGNRCEPQDWTSFQALFAELALFGLSGSSLENAIHEISLVSFPRYSCMSSFSLKTFVKNKQKLKAYNTCLTCMKSQVQKQKCNSCFNIAPVGDSETFRPNKKPAGSHSGAHL